MPPYLAGNTEFPEQLDAFYEIAHELIVANNSLLDYHAEPHTFADVVPDAIKLGLIALGAGKITQQEFVELTAAAIGHDVIYEPGQMGFNEIRSAMWAFATLKSHEAFSSTSVPLNTANLILTTSVDLSVPGEIRQDRDHNTYASGLLLDADLTSFGKPFEVYFDRALRYFKEIHRNVTDPALRQLKFIEFLKTNVQILRNQDFHTVEARTAFPHRKQNADILENLLNTSLAN